jgi:hypothetical protein
MMAGIKPSDLVKSSCIASSSAFSFALALLVRELLPNSPGIKTKNPLGLLRQRVMRILVLANRYAHLIKRGAKPW